MCKENPHSGVESRESNGFALCKKGYNCFSERVQCGLKRDRLNLGD